MKHVIAVLIAVLIGHSSAVAQTTRVEIRYDVPAELAGYSGVQPVTFGVPFEKDTLANRTPMHVVDGDGNVLPSQFETSSTWAADRKFVRWLLVDTVAHIENGKAKPAFLVIGEMKRPVSMPRLSIRVKAGVATANMATQPVQIGSDVNTLGTFTLTTGDGKVYRPTGEYKVTPERLGPVRCVVRSNAKYVDEEGNSIADAITRYRFYPEQPFVRIYHTMIWQTEDETEIGSLTFETAGEIANTKSSVGIDGKTITGDNASAKQIGAHEATGPAEGKHIDGWAMAANDQQSVFAAVRWPWQQFPTRLSAANGKVSIGLIGPDDPMSLRPADIAVQSVQPPREYNLWDIQDIVVGAKKVEAISPRGVAKTWEILLWFGDTDDRVTPEQKNATLQTPVIAYADPAFATKADLPSPISPYDPNRFPVVESSLKRAFNWFTIPQEREGDFGTWNFGDVQWGWTLRGWPIYRYWMNNGKGFSILPWVLYLRSGDRQYLDFGEANNRHVMDVDTCHVPEWTYQPDGKRRGAPYSYSAMHWASGPFLAEFQAESEYLPNYYYMTGYERARDVMKQSAEALARFEYEERWLKDFRADRLNAHRHLYAMVKELGVLYEATWDKRLKERLDEYFDLTMKAPNPDGDFPNVKTNHYLSQPLNIAMRMYGPERVLPVMQNWQAYRGDTVRVGSYGSISGPMSLWTLVTLAKEANDAHLLNIASQAVNAQAWVIAENDTEWNGMHPTWGPETGPILRDWVTTMAGISKLNHEVATDKVLPMASLHGRLPMRKADEAAGYKWRHVMLVNKTQGEQLLLRIFGLSKNKTHTRIINAENETVRKQDDDFSNFEGANGTIAINLEAALPAGIYAVELLTRNRFPEMLRAETSNGKLLHLLSRKQMSFVSFAKAGQLWGQAVGEEDVVIGLVQNQFAMGQSVIRNEAGDVLATSEIVGTFSQKVNEKSRIATQWQPKGVPCILPAAKTDPDEMLQMILPVSGESHLWYSITGIKPYVSIRRSEWFDLNEQLHPDIATLVQPEAAD